MQSTQIIDNITYFILTFRFS